MSLAPRLSRLLSWKFCCFRTRVGYHNKRTEVDQTTNNSPPGFPHRYGQASDLSASTRITSGFSSLPLVLHARSIRSSVHTRASICFHPYRIPTQGDNLSYRFSAHDRSVFVGHPIEQLSARADVLTSFTKSFGYHSDFVLHRSSTVFVNNRKLQLRPDQ